MLEDTSASHSTHCLVLRQDPKHLMPGRFLFNLFIHNNISQASSYCCEGGSILCVALSPCEEQPWKNRRLKQEKRPRRSQCPVSGRCQKQALREEQASRYPSLGIFPYLQQFQCFPEPELLSLTVIGFLFLSSNSCRLSEPAASRYLLDL